MKHMSCNIGTVYQRVRCPSYHIVPNGQCSANNVHVIQPTRAPKMEKCGETGGPFKTAGPIWLGPLHDTCIVQEAIGRLENLMHEKKKKKQTKKNEEETASTETSAISLQTKEEGTDGGGDKYRSKDCCTDNNSNVEFLQK